MDPLAVPDESLAALERVASEAASYLAELKDAPVRSSTSDEAAERFGGRLPDEGVGTMTAIEELLRDGIDAHVRSGGPRFFHWVIGGSTPAALAADWLTSLLDQNAGGWDATPLGSRLEKVSIDWLLELFGLPEQWSGVLTTGATTANFAALAAARQWWGEQHGVDVSEDGLAGLPQTPILSSGFIHISARKALAMLGLGRNQVVDCSAPDGSFDLQRLEHALDERPAIVIANAGEVNAGHFDPIREVVEIAHAHNAWVHVDGAFGLFARISPRVAQLADGVETADSVISDGHKWLNVPYDCGFAFVRDPAYLGAAFTAGAAYLPEQDEERPVFGFMGPELSRRARCLSVWATLRAYGRDGYRAIVERCLDNAAHLARLVDETEDAELLLPAPLNIVFFRYRPPDAAEDELDELNLAIEREILKDGRVYLGTTRWNGVIGFRPAFVNWRSTREDAGLVLETVRDLGQRLRSRSRPQDVPA
ncbi:MAG TPA: aminotransferase class V-fold PLP-dependent enzyme [Gaiellaceae bacterium]